MGISSRIKSVFFTGLVSLSVVGCSQPELQEFIVGDQRQANEIERNGFRHPVETLQFFDVQPDHTVVEIWPGSGWYASILAPFLQENGQYIAAHFDPESKVAFFRNSRAAFETRIKSHPAYANVEMSIMEPPEHLALAPESTADRVLTFRNVHNWMRNGSEQAAFDGFYKALKPGGILGVVEHRAPDSFSIEKMIESGYVSEQYVIELAEKAGFELLGRSEINRNPQDTKQHKNGVWTLPPTLRVSDEDRAKMLSIGESDRMTLKFIKRV